MTRSEWTDFGIEITGMVVGGVVVYAPCVFLGTNPWVAAAAVGVGAHFGMLLFARWFGQGSPRSGGGEPEKNGPVSGTGLPSQKGRSGQADRNDGVGD